MVNYSKDFRTLLSLAGFISLRAQNGLSAQKMRKEDTKVGVLVSSRGLVAINSFTEFLLKKVTSAKRK